MINKPIKRAKLHDGKKESFVRFCKGYVEYFLISWCQVCKKNRQIFEIGHAKNLVKMIAIVRKLSNHVKFRQTIPKWPSSLQKLKFFSTKFPWNWLNNPVCSKTNVHMHILLFIGLTKYFSYFSNESSIFFLLYHREKGEIRQSTCVRIPFI